MLLALVVAADLVTLPATVPGQNDLRSHIRRMELARDRKDWAAMEQACRAGVAAGFKDEYLLRSLSWALCRQGKNEEAVSVALQNYKANPCVWSLVQYVEATAQSGDFDEARQGARMLLKNKQHWCSAGNAALNAVDLVSSKTYRFTWTIDPARERYQKHIHPDIRVPLPWTDKPYQTASWSVIGAHSHRLELLGDNQWVRVTPQGAQQFRLVAEVTLTPYSYRRRAESAVESDYPADVKKYLGRSGVVDPESERIKALAATLRASSRFKTIENVLDWTSRNLRYIGTGQAGGSADVVLERGGGHCEALTTSTVTLLRACGIPARYIRGHGAVAGSRGNGSWHTITEYYVSGVGWIQWDQHYPAFVVRPTYLCTFHYQSPYDTGVKGVGGDPAMRDLWNFQGLGLKCEFVNFELLRSELK